MQKAKSPLNLGVTNTAPSQKTPLPPLTRLLILNTITQCALTGLLGMKDLVLLKLRPSHVLSYHCLNDQPSLSFVYLSNTGWQNGSPSNQDTE
jgi:hypothetical protein